MKIVADENIPFVEQALAEAGSVQALPGRSITADTIRDADALLVRTVTKVNASLLESSPVKFVGTATAGTDHVDVAYLRNRNIAFASAAGSNAASVADYVTAALLHLNATLDLNLDAMSIGIIGMGNVGRRVAKRAAALGMRCVINDPPLERSSAEPLFRPLEEALACDVVTLHVPLERSGADATYHLVDEAFLDSMKPGAILINTSRGGVVDTSALKETLQSGKLKACVLDVWENEPAPDTDLIELATIASPHIAGYAFDGKVEGTRQVAVALYEHFGIESTWDPAPFLGQAPCLSIDPGAPKPLQQAVQGIYDIMLDDAPMRELMTLAPEARAQRFDELRKTYRQRREFGAAMIDLTRPDATLQHRLEGLGFTVRSATQ